MASPTAKPTNKTMKPTLILTAPCKGGVGKTTAAALIADYLISKEISVTMLDADEKSGAGLAHFLPQAKRISLTKRDALDALANAVTGGSQVTLCDMPAAREVETQKWFADVAAGLAEICGIVTVCVISPDPGSISPVLDWASEIKGLTEYVLVRNEQEQPDHDWHFWQPRQAAFLEITGGEVLDLKSVNPDLQAALRVHGETLARVASGSAIPELASLVWKIRAQSVWSYFANQLLKSKLLNV